MDLIKTLGSAIPLAGLAYLCGSIPWGFIIGKFNGLDIRKHGSGNIGATNVRRVLGRDWGILCFALDFLKGLVPVLICSRLGAALPVGAETGGLVAAAGTVAGHVWPVWLRFRGGKGVATTIGALIAVAPVPIVVAMVVWVIVFLSSRYVSLASLMAAVALPVAGAVQANLSENGPRAATFILLALLAAMIIWRHRGNLQRLREGTEFRFERGRRR